MINQKQERKHQSTEEVQYHQGQISDSPIVITLDELNLKETNDPKIQATF